MERERQQNDSLVNGYSRCDPACTDVVAPAFGSIGDCPANGILPYGSTCSLACDADYALSGSQPSCATVGRQSHAFHAVGASLGSTGWN